MPQPSLKDMTVAAIDALNTNQNARALELSARAITQYAQAGHLQRLAFVLAAERTIVPPLADLLKKAMESTLGYDDIENQRLFPGWYYIFKTSPSFAAFWENPFDWKKIEPVLQNKFLVEGVKNLNFLDWDLEQLCTRLRRDFLLEHFPNGRLKTKHLPILCALAEHCFLNEYVFETVADERDAIEKIMPDNPVSVALIGCYKPLAGIPFDEKMSAVAGFRSLVQTQVGNVREERSFGFNSAITDTVTKNVATMYEENPYPRWSNINKPHMKVRDIEADILLAGCGTGQMAAGFSAALPNCAFTAIDISRTSLAYAARMAQAHSIENVEFIHLSILDAQKLGKSFDYIECSGVLHHMEDPEAGWRALLSCLKSGGGMQIALYSKITRGSIDAVRDHIKKKGYQPTPDGIRNLRADIAALPEGDPLKEIMRMRDFYSTSMVRDLVFHIQETSYTLPEIENMMERLGLAFDGFKINEAVKEAYRARFKDDPAMTNLKNWDIFENEHPDTFIGMYRIFCHKKGENVSEPVTRIRDIQI